MTTGDKNTCIGYDAGGALTTGSANTIIGENAGSNGAITGDDNTVVGKIAGYALTSGHSNTLIGRHSASALNTGARNTALGYGALDSAADGENDNTAIGYNALAGASLAGAEYNVAIGNYSLDAITSADYCVAIGNNAGSAITTGGKHILIGHNAGSGLTTSAGSCIYIGTGAGSGAGNDTETNNIGIGEDTIGAAGNTINGAEYNVAIGNLSLDALTTADNNVAIGYKAGTAVTSGGHNVIIGFEAGINVNQGYMNTILGRQAGYTTTTGNQNTFIGTYAGYYSTGASYYNSCLGYLAGHDLTSGDNNLMLGREAGRSTSPSGSVTTADNQICLGDDNITAIFCADTSISSSDKRDKTDIKNFTTGLSFIEKMQPVTYKWDKRSWYSDDLSATPDGSKKAIETNVGFLAQDVETLEKEIGFANDKDDMLFVNLSNDGQRYGMKYERLVTVLVNSIKELSAKVKTLEEA